ncbi:MAG: sigma-70 family RNA polymerase sigma factor [Ilumatobacteraceae bacterium]
MTIEQIGPGAPDATNQLDDASQAWVDGLQATGAAHDRCVAQLHALLLRVARHEARRKATSVRIEGQELDDVVNQVADDALMAIKSKVADFRGESRFTTWAYRFVVYEVSTKIGRHCWRNRPDALDADAWERIPDSLAMSPHLASEQRESLVVLRDAIDNDLTDLQRRVFVAIALNEVPVDAFARELGSNRNAVYKTLFDARRKLRACLASAGHARPELHGAM